VARRWATYSGLLKGRNGEMEGIEEANELNSKRYPAGMWIRPLVLREMMKFNGISQGPRARKRFAATCILSLTLTKPPSGRVNRCLFPPLSLWPALATNQRGQRWGT
jgi:hypothetical protein